MNRLKQYYQEKILAKLKQELNIKNDLAVPRLKRIIITMGIGDSCRDKGLRDKIVAYMSAIAGQKVQFCQTKRSIAEFGIRQGDSVGIKATLRGERAYEFLDKLCSIVLPRVRDFQGVKANAFDQNGNYNLALKEQIIFPEVDYDKIDRIRGLQITINTTAKNKEEAYLLLKELGMPFEKN
ncbi:50S ribosomal protein L5 [Candidatus Beckwithbacteria bacterium]|nr:50S ribosomal protein L5 [Candidatus Beckwithbacteria bacterium]